MRMFFGLAVLALSFNSMASTGETRTFNYDGSESTVELLMKGEKTHTEYKTEDVQSTCYRQEVVGYTTSCMSGNYRPYPPGYPGNFPGGYYDPRYRYPQPGWGGMGTCIQQPIYRSVPYSCIKTVRTPFEVKDYDVDAKVTVEVMKNSALASVEKFTVVLSGDSVALNVVGSKSFLVVLNKQNVTGKLEGGVKSVEAKYIVELVEAAPVLKALKMTEISVEDGILSFDLGPVATRADLALSLNVVKKKVGADKELFNRELTSNEVALTATRSGTDAKVNVPALGVALADGKFALTAKAAFKPRGTLLNRVQFGDEALSTSRTLIYKIR